MRDSVTAETERFLLFMFVYFQAYIFQMLKQKRTHQVYPFISAYYTTICERVRENLS